ncbi:MAG: D-lactate dehydrogenase [Pseudomonadota bacterium]|nr:D-lactate dehydrogenase [Pseudomonadota bacterium]
MFELFVNAIKGSISKDQIIEDELLRYAYSTDASLYRMVPKLVLVIKKESEVLDIIKAANDFDVKLTFRAAGTSVSGQAVTDQVLVMLAKDGWLKHTVIDNGAEIKLEPGIIGADANSYLKNFKRKIGPDPGSIHAAKIGGIVANNSSGMCCGTAKNSYATIKSIRAILADGSILDTGNEKLLSAFKTNKHDLLSGIEHIRQKIVQDSDLVSFIRKKFSIKNTSGYSLNAFLDFEDPIKILERLMVGSEGTLGFISNVNLRTVPDYDFKALNLIYGKLSDLVDITVKIAGFDVSSVELLGGFSFK